jgi:S-DNA-T family DNA segregation ATPase FtsK/SpoIIIE
MGAAGAVRLPRRFAVEAVEPRRRLRYEVIGLGLFALGIVLLLGAARESGLVAPVLYHGLSYLAGRVGAFLISVALLILGAVMVLRWERVDFGRLAAGFGILLWLMLAIWELALPSSGVLGRAFASEPGGLLGVLVAEMLRPLFGPGVSILILSLAGLWAVGYISDTPLVTLMSGGAWVMRFIGGVATSALAGLFCAAVSMVRSVARAGWSVSAWAIPRVRGPAPLPPPQQPRRRRRKVEPPHPIPSEAEEEEPQDEPAPKGGSPRLQLLDSGAGAEVDESREPSPEYANFELPGLDLLTEPPSSEEAEREALASRDTLEEALGSYGIDAHVVDVERGPRVTRYEIMLPPGVRVSKITNLADDLAYALKALAVRVEAPVPGKGVIGIEVPNPEVTFVHLREIMGSPAAQRMKSKVAFALGRDISGTPMMADLATMPHLLIAGATNSGKSVSLNSLITSILFRARPDEVKFLLIDPKRVELSLFEGIPHLAAPVAHDAKESAGLLRWAIREMELRYSQFADVGTRNIKGWNERARMDDDMDPMYYLVIVVDELADLMMQAATEFETSICRLAQLARATGIHLVVATQRPSVNVITGTIKANIASRIAFAVASQVDSRTILDINGAERLVGSGDMLFLPLDAPTGKPVRLQGAYISERDLNEVVEFLKKQAQPHYAKGALESAGSIVLSKGEEDGVEDEMFETALDFVLATKHASASMLQRKFKLGYTRAARLIDMMEERGYVGPHDGRKPREVYGTPADRIAELARSGQLDDEEEADEEEDFDDSEEPEDYEDE